MAHTPPILSTLILILVTTINIHAETISPNTPNNNSNVSFSGVDMVSLLQSLGMTQNDLNNLRDSVNAGNSTIPLQSTTNSSVSAAVNTNSSGSVTGSNVGQAIPKSTAVQGESLKMTDLSELQKQLGLNSKSGQSANISATPSSNQSRGIATATANSVAINSGQPAVKNMMPQVNPQTTQTATLQNVSQPNQSATTVSTNSYDFLSQFNSLVTSTSGGVIPLNSAVSASSPFSAMPGFMDLSSLQQQLGLLPRPASSSTNQSKSLQPDNNKSSVLSQPTASASSNKSTAKLSTSQIKNNSNTASSASGSVGLNQSANTSSALTSTTQNLPAPLTPSTSTSPSPSTSTSPSPSTSPSTSAALSGPVPSTVSASQNSSLSSSQSRVSNNKGSAINQPVSSNAVNATKTDSQVQIASADNKTTSTIDQAKLLQSLADLQRLLDQLSTNKITIKESTPPNQTTSANSVNGTATTTNQPLPTNRTSNSVQNTTPLTTNTINVNLQSITQLTAQPTTQTTANTSQPTTNQPTTNQPTTSQPTTNQPTTNQPTTNQPTTNQPTTNQPTTNQPTTNTVATSNQASSSVSKVDANLNQVEKIQPIQQPIRPVVTQPAINTLPQYSQPQVVISRLDPKFYQPYQVSSNSTSQTNRNNQQQSLTPNQNINSFYTSPLQLPQNNLQTQTVTQQYQISGSPAAQPSPLSAVQSYQQVSGSNLAVYSLNATYRQFAGSFVLAINDVNLPALRNYLSKNYGAYLNQGSIVSGFREFSSFDDSIEYQLLYKTIYGTFNAILNFNLATNAIVLKSLSVINFFILEIDISNCMIKDGSQNSCKVCNAGYRNFMGRCRQLDSSCIQYLTDECGACMNGSRLSRGVCV